VPDKLTWRIVEDSLITAKYDTSTKDVTKKAPAAGPRKIAAFDLDDTIIKPAGAKWARNASSWKWWDPCVPGKLRELHRDGYLVVIVSNQAIISLKEKDTTSLRNFKLCLGSMLPQLDIPISVYAATGQDNYRKPRIGMWLEILEDHDLDAPDAVDYEGSIFVGDASGRAKTDTRPKDHSSADRFAGTLAFPNVH
jgi:bifunctional polynucleotide phosphatase/kinase